MRKTRGGASLALLTWLLSLASWSLGLTTLDNDDLRNIPSPGDDFDILTGPLLSPILIPRVPGSEGSLKALQHITGFFQSQLPDWELLWHNFTSKTPATGDQDVPFSNLIFRRDPPGHAMGEVSRLTLVAHFDSKKIPVGFIGATDSALPCAILLHVARSIDGALKTKWEADNDDGNRLEQPEGVQIIFLDGEEAFVDWSADDSLYGARALASAWESTSYPYSASFRSPLDSISLFVLLDLLGSKDPSIPSYFLTTHWAYRNIATIEKRMRGLGLLESKPVRPFLPDADKQSKEFGRGFIEDDHIPFMHRGVDVLHLIPSPFPAVWHRMEDDGQHLDLPTAHDWASIVTAFTAEWMDLKGFLPEKTAGSGKGAQIADARRRRSEL